jgi:small-conductance mechanosensitive channel
MRYAKAPAILMVVLAASALLLLSAAPADADAAAGDVGIVAYQNDLRVNAGNSVTFTIEAVNYLGYSATDITNYRMISISFSSDYDVFVSVSSGDQDFVLMGQEHRSITVTVDVGRYAAAGPHEISVILTVRTLNETSSIITTTPLVLDVDVLSPLSSGDAFNRLLGIFKNPLPDPFNTPLATSIISFVLWMLIGAIALLLVVPVIFRTFARKYEEDGKKLNKGLKTFVPIVLLLFAFDSSLRIYGASERIVGPIETWFEIFYIILGAMIVWMAYLVLVHRTVSKMSKNKRVDHKDMDIEPLLRLLGKLVIAVMAVALMMSAWGFNLTAVITGAGIVGLGITLGAQHVLNQFFSGMVLLLTRPFKSGDLVKMGTNTTISTMIYRVLAVNIMSTVFENWDNKETVIMPNNMVASSAIVNMTGDGLIYKITVFMRIALDSDIDVAKDLMTMAAMSHPSVISNGTVDLPSARTTSFLDSGVELRLSCYVYDFNDGGSIASDLRETIYKSFKENGINIPNPQIDVHVDPVRKGGQKKTKKD